MLIRHVHTSRRFGAALLCLLTSLAGAHARGAPPSVVPVPTPEAEKWTRVDGAVPGKLFVLAAEPASKWRLESAGCELRSFDGGKTGVFLASAPGVYRLTVTGPAGDVSQIEVAVGKVDPKPGPDPKPEPPADPLKAKVKAAFDADTAAAAEKKSQAKALAELYRQIGAKVCPDPAVTLPSELVERARKAAELMVTADALIGVRKVVGEELAGLLPVDDPLSDDQRGKVGQLFKRLGEILDAVGAG